MRGTNHAHQRDPLYRAHYKAATPVEHCADCALIARVRAEYQTPHGSTPWHLGYQQARRECGCA